MELGVRPGDTVAVMLPRTAELMIALLGTLRMGAVYQPLFTAFGTKAVEHRVTSSGAQVVVTDDANRAKLASLPPSLRVVRVSDAAGHGDIDFHTELARQPTDFPAVPCHPDDPMLAMFTSGTTGAPKAVIVPQKALLSFEVYMRFAVDVREEDVFWNIADPGWAYGLYYAALGPLAMGHATTFYSGSFTADSTCRVIEKYGVSNLAGAPTAFRHLIAHGEEVARRIAGKLRVVSSAGEALNPEVIRWFKDSLGVSVHDHYGQTEGGMLLANHHGLSHTMVRGSAGLAVPGFRLAILDDGMQELPAGQIGQLAVDRESSPLYWFGGYSTPKPAEGRARYHCTGDLAKMNLAGTVTFVGRADDVITSSGYRIGPFDVESALMEHPLVAESAVVGKPDPQRTELVKAFVVLKPGALGSDGLAAELQALVKERLSAHAYPREIEFVAELPKTPSGKIQRFVLRQWQASEAAVRA